MRLLARRLADQRHRLSASLERLPWLVALAVLLPAFVVGAGLPHAWLGPWVVIALAPLLASCASASPRKGAALLFMTWHLGYSLLARPYLELSPVLVVAAPILCATLYALAWWALRSISGATQVAPAVLATLFFSVEMVKSAAGLEYGNLSYGLWPWLPALPLVAWVGAPGLSWLVWYVNAAIAARVTKQLSTGGLVRRGLCVGAGLLAAALLPHSGERGGELTVVADSWGHSIHERRQQGASASVRARALAERLGAAVGRIPADVAGDVVVLWPETALQWTPAQEQLLEERLAEVDLSRNVKIVSGAFGPRGAGGLATNTVYVFDSQGKIEDRYDKVRLIPFDESQPLQVLSDILFDRETLTEFAPGDSLEPLTVGETLAGISICYEETFPWGFAEQVDRGAAVLFTCANYSYFSSPLAPAFIEALSRFRARETGRSLVRASNGRGVDHIDRLGRLLEHHEDGVPQALRVVEWTGATPFVHGGRFAVLPLALLAAMSAQLCTRRERRGAAPSAGCHRDG